MGIIPDPTQPMAHSAQLEGGSMTFLSPELLIPEEFGKKNAVPTQESDVYAFGLVIFQVSERGYEHQLFLCTIFTRSLRVKCHSAVSDNRRSHTTYSAENAPQNRRMPPTSGFPNPCGRSPKTVGIAQWSRDQRLGGSRRALGLHRPTGAD